MINQKYHFDITPHIVKQLGEQLVSDEITALLELIKNSFDADATYVSIEINTTGQYTKEKLFYPNHRGFIVVEDDGFGMSENTIMKSWLLISYSQKRELKEAKKKTPEIKKKKEKRKEVTTYVVTEEYDEKEVGEYASAGKDKLWL